MNVRTTGKPPAEPVSDERFVASHGKPDAALAAWLASRGWARPRPAEQDDDEVLSDEDADAVFEELFASEKGTSTIRCAIIAAMVGGAN